MTFDEYINNPMGIKNAVFSNRNMYRNMYTEKFNTLLVRENNKFDYSIFKSKKAIFILIKVPSEVVKDFYYDVVLKFDIDSTTTSNIKKCDMKFFSNDPSFVYTFAHSFIKNGIFVKELTPRMSKEAIKLNAKERNPNNEVGYVKSIYFAYLIMQNKGLFNLSKLNIESKPYNEKILLDLVEQASTKIEKRKELGDELSKKKSIDKKKQKQKTQVNQDASPKNSVNITKTIGGRPREKRISVTKSVKSTSSANKIKKSRKI